MGNPLRDRRTPSDFAESGQVIEFSEKIDEFERLSEIVKGDLETLDPDKLQPDWRDSVIEGQLSFGFSGAQDGLPALQGKAGVTLSAVCQRCLEAFQMPLSVDIRLLFGAEDAAAVIDGYEVWELEEDTLRPLDIVEEALIMALPLAAKHVDDKACKEPGQEQGSSDRIRPFADLRSQMEKND